MLTFVLWHQVQDDGPTRLLGGAIVLDGFALFITVVICIAIILDRAVPRRLPASARASTGSEVYVLLLHVGDRAAS